jgi:hypothetical protein
MKQVVELWGNEVTEKQKVELKEHKIECDKELEKIREESLKEDKLKDDLIIENIKK